jgi:hypothetical protein
MRIMPTPAAHREHIAPERLLAPYPDDIRAIAGTLRSVVRHAVPGAIERVRPGWLLIGYDLPIGRRTTYFAYIAPEPIHCHLGFAYGVAMADPDRLLEGAHLGLRQVRYLTYRPGQAVPEAACHALVLEAARVAAMSRDQRSALVLDRAWAPPPSVAD